MPTKKTPPAKRTVSKEFMKIAKEYGRVPMEYRQNMIKKMKKMARENVQMNPLHKKILRKLGLQVDLSTCVSPKAMPKMTEILNREDKTALELADMLQYRKRESNKYLTKYRFVERGMDKARIRKIDDKDRKAKRFHDFLRLSAKKQKDALTDEFIGKN